MHVTDFENLDCQHKYQEMMTLIEQQDPMWLDWIKLSRLTFGPWQIEEHKPFQEKYLEYVTNYESIDVRSFTEKANLWLSKPQGQP